MKRTITALLLVLLFLTGLTACGEPGEISMTSSFARLPEPSNLDPEDYYDPDTDYPCQFYGLGIAATDIGYYFIEGEFLFFIDKETLAVVPLCNRPNCLHTMETDPEKVWKCNAFLGKSKEFIPFVQYYNGKIYAMSYFNQERGGNESQLVEISLDGSSRKKLGKVAEPSGIRIHRGYLYYEIIKPTKTSIVRKKLDQLEGEPELLYTYGDTDFDCYITFIYGTHLYLNVASWLDGIEFAVTRTYDYNLKTGEMAQILTTEEESKCGIRSTICDIADGRIYYTLTDASTTYSDGTTYRVGDLANIVQVCDLNGSNSMKLFEMNEVGELAGTFRTDGTYQYIFLLNRSFDNPEVQSRKNATVYDDKMNKITEVPLGSLPYSYTLCKGDSNYLFFRYYDRDENGLMYYHLDVVDKKDFENGNPQLRQVFKADFEELYPEVRWSSR